jgi:hypothetical protein
VKQFPFVPCSAEGGARTRARARNRTSLYIPFDYEHEHRFTEHEHETERSRNEPYYPLKFLNNRFLQPLCSNLRPRLIHSNPQILLTKQTHRLGVGATRVKSGDSDRRSGLLTTTSYQFPLKAMIG